MNIWRFHPPRVKDSRKYQTKIPIPAGKYGEFEIEKKTLPAGQTLEMITGPNICFKNNVVFTILKNGGVITSDTPMEIESNERYVSDMEGKVLVAGLGLSIVIKILYDNPKITKIVIIEIEKDIIRMNLKYQKWLKNPKIAIIQDNVYKMKMSKLKDEHFDWMYVDIWNDICTDNRPQFYCIRKKYKPVCGNFEYWSHYEMQSCR